MGRVNATHSESVARPQTARQPDSREATNYGYPVTRLPPASFCGPAAAPTLLSITNI